MKYMLLIIGDENRMNTVPTVADTLRAQVHTAAALYEKHFGHRPRGMWLGLTAGLSVAAFLLCRRFLRSSRRVPISKAAPSVTVTDAA